METGHTCEICSRVFPSGKALGGHMKAHFAFHPLPPRSETLSDSNTQIKSKQIKPSSSMRNKEDTLGHLIKDNTGKSIPPLIDLVHSSSSEKISHQPDVIELDTSSEESIDPVLFASSIEEEVAFILVHMSEGEIIDSTKQMDKGKQKLEENNHRNDDDQKFGDNNDSDDENEDEHSLHNDKSDQLQLGEEQSIHHSETCMKVFTSSRNPQEQKETNVKLQVQIDITNTNGNERGMKLIKHKCSSCSRFFRSGRALGAHKKIHRSLLNSKEPKLPDLNLPPPDEDDDEDANNIN